MTTLGGPDYDNLLVATNDNGLIDYSFIDMTTSKSANKLVKTLSTGLLNINLLPTSTTGATNKIPVVTSGTTLSNSWLNTTNGTGDLAANKVVITGSDKLISNNLLNTTEGSSTTTANNASKIVKTTTDGKINDNLLKTTKSGGTANANTIVKLDANGLLDPSLFRTDQFIPLTGGEPSGNILVIKPGNSSNKTLDNLNSKYPDFYGFGASSYTDGFLIGMNGDSDSNTYLVLATLDNGTEPIYVRQYGGSQGYLNMPGNMKHEITLMDKDGYTTVNKLTSSGNISSTEGSLSIEKTSSLKGNVTIGTSSTASTLTTYGTGYFVRTTDLSGTADNKPALIVGGTNSQAHIEIDPNEIQAKASGTTTAKIWINTDGGDVAIGKDSTITLSKNVSVTNTLSVTGNTTIGSSSTNSNLKVYGASTLDGKVTTGSSTSAQVVLDAGNITATGTLSALKGHFTSTTDAQGTIDTTPGLQVGSHSGKHLEIDNDEIMAKASATTVSPLYLNNNGGLVNVGSGGLKVSGNTESTGTLDVTGLITAKGGIHIPYTSDAVVLNNSDNPALSIGTRSGRHIAIDDNEIMAKSNASTVGPLYIQIGNKDASADKAKVGNGGDTYFGGPVYIGGAITAYNNITASGKTITAKTFSGTATNLATESGTSSGARPVWYSYLGDNTKAVYHADNFMYNPGTKTVTAGNFSGNWSGYTNSLSTSVTPSSSSQMVIKDGTALKYATASSIVSAGGGAKFTYKTPATQTLIFGSLTDKSKAVMAGKITFTKAWNTFDALLIVATNDGKTHVATTILPVWELEKRKTIAQAMGIVKYEFMRTHANEYWYINTNESTYTELYSYDTYENSGILAVVGLKW